MARDVRMALVGPDLVVRNVVQVKEGWKVPEGLAGIESATAATRDLYDPVSGVFRSPPERLAEDRAAVVEAIQARRNELMARGAPFAGHRIEVDDASRANLGGVVTKALIAALGFGPWPEQLKQGWIALDNERVPLPAPTDAIMLGLSVLGWYSGLIQFARDLKSSVLASEDFRGVAAAADWTPWE